MNASVIFGLCLAVVFFSAIIWLIIHARRQEREYRKGDIAPENRDRNPEPQK